MSMSSYERRSKKNPALPPDLRLGQLLIQFGIVTGEDISRGLRLSSGAGLPLGKALVLLDCISDLVLQDVVQAQSMLRDGLIDLDQANQAFEISSRMKISIEKAFIVLEIRLGGLDCTRLGNLLKASHKLKKDQLDLGLRIASNSGLPLGQVLVELNFISQDTLDVTLRLQRELREGEPISNRALKKELRKADITLPQLPTIDTQKVLLGQLLVESGVVDSTALERALNAQQNNSLPLGQFLVETGVISDRILKLALNLQLLLFNKKTTRESACLTLKQALEQEVKHGDFNPSEDSFSFGDFLTASNYLNIQREQEVVSRLEQDAILRVRMQRMLQDKSAGNAQTLMKLVIKNKAVLRSLLIELMPEEREVLDCAYILYLMILQKKMTSCQAIVDFTIKRNRMVCAQRRPA
ncbi:hypothetical protein KA183_02705 [bacterium]|nr:hypothetical protein [bacterium]